MRSASWSHTWRLASSKILIHTLGREKTLDAMRVLWQTRLHLKLTLIVFIRCYVQSKHGQWMNSWRMSYLFIRLLVFISSHHWMLSPPSTNSHATQIHLAPPHIRLVLQRARPHGTVLHADSRAGAHWVSEQASTWASSCDSQELHVPGSSSSSKAGAASASGPYAWVMFSTATRISRQLQQACCFGAWVETGSSRHATEALS
jgi:hypothetical protein